jgi:hypothetical protein
VEDADYSSKIGVLVKLGVIKVNLLLSKPNELKMLLLFLKNEFQSALSSVVWA